MPSKTKHRYLPSAEIDDVTLARKREYWRSKKREQRARHVSATKKTRNENLAMSMPSASNNPLEQIPNFSNDSSQYMHNISSNLDGNNAAKIPKNSCLLGTETNISLESRRQNRRLQNNVLPHFQKTSTNSIKTETGDQQMKPLVGGLSNRGAKMVKCLYSSRTCSNLHPKSSQLQNLGDGKPGMSSANYKDSTTSPQKHTSMVLPDRNNQNFQRSLISEQYPVNEDINSPVTSRNSCAFASKSRTEVALTGEEITAKRRENWRIKKREQRAKRAAKLAQEGEGNLREGETSSVSIRYASHEILEENSKSNGFRTPQHVTYCTKPYPVSYTNHDMDLAQPEFRGTKTNQVSWTNIGNSGYSHQRTTRPHAQGSNSNQVILPKSSMRSENPPCISLGPMDNQCNGFHTRPNLESSTNYMGPVNAVHLNQQPPESKFNSFQAAEQHTRGGQKPNPVSCLNQTMQSEKTCVSKHLLDSLYNSFNMEPNHHMEPVSCAHSKQQLETDFHSQGSKINFSSSNRYSENSACVSQLPYDSRSNDLNTMQYSASCTNYYMESTNSANSNQKPFGTKFNGQGPKSNNISRTNSIMHSENPAYGSQSQVETQFNDFKNHVSSASNSVHAMKPPHNQSTGSASHEFQTSHCVLGTKPNIGCSVSSTNHTMCFEDAVNFNEERLGTELNGFRTIRQPVQGIKPNHLHHSVNAVSIKQSAIGTFNRFLDLKSNNLARVGQPSSSSTQRTLYKTNVPRLVQVHRQKQMRNKLLKGTKFESPEDRHARMKEYWRTKKREQRARLSMALKVQLKERIALPQARSNPKAQVKSSQTVQCFTTKDTSILGNFSEASLQRKHNFCNVKIIESLKIHHKTDVPLDPLTKCNTKNVFSQYVVSRNLTNGYQRSKGKSKVAKDSTKGNHTPIQTEEERIARLREYWRTKKREQRARIGSGLLRSKVLLLKQRKQIKKSTQRHTIGLSNSTVNESLIDPPTPIKEEHIYPTIQSVFSIPALTPCVNIDVSELDRESSGGLSYLDSTLEAVASMKKIFEESLTTLEDNDVIEVQVKREEEPVPLTNDDPLESENVEPYFEDFDLIKQETLKDDNFEDIDYLTPFEDTSLDMPKDDPVGLFLLAEDPQCKNMQKFSDAGANVKHLQTYQIEELGKGDKLQKKREYWRIMKRQQRAKRASKDGNCSISQQTPQKRASSAAPMQDTSSATSQRRHLPFQRNSRRRIKPTQTRSGNRSKKNRSQRVAAPKPLNDPEELILQRRMQWRIKKQEQRARKAAREGKKFHVPVPLQNQDAQAQTQTGFASAVTKSEPSDDRLVDLTESSPPAFKEAPEEALSASEWRERYLMDLDAVSLLLVCMVCGGQLYSVSVREAEAHVQELHPETLALGASERSCFLDAWDEQVAVREHSLTRQLQR